MFNALSLGESFGTAFQQRLLDSSVMVANVYEPSSINIEVQSNDQSIKRLRRSVAPIFTQLSNTTELVPGNKLLNLSLYKKLIHQS